MSDCLQPNCLYVLLTSSHQPALRLFTVSSVCVKCCLVNEEYDIYVLTETRLPTPLPRIVPRASLISGRPVSVRPGSIAVRALTRSSIADVCKDDNDACSQKQLAVIA